MKCTYPDCNCPFDMGADEKCLIGYEASGMSESIKLDKAYAQEKLQLLLRDLPYYTADEFWRQMSRIASGATGLPASEDLQKRIAELEAERDRLMLEFCPDEMKEEQIKRWGECQKASGMSDEAELDQQLELILRAVGKSLKLYPMGMSIADIRQELKQAMLKSAPEQPQTALIEFVKWVLDTTARGCSLDGDDVTQKAVELGLVAREEVTEPCSEGCACSDHGFPTICYRFTDLLKAAPEQKWIKFDYANPPSDEVAWFELVSPDYDVDVDDYGNTVGYPTGESSSRIVLGELEYYEDPSGFEYFTVFAFSEKQQTDLEVINSYLPIQKPQPPGEDV